MVMMMMMVIKITQGSATTRVYTNPHVHHLCCMGGGACVMAVSTMGAPVLLEDAWTVVPRRRRRCVCTLFCVYEDR